MTFLQPYLLFGLLAAAVPVLIHLINRRQQLTIPWGAMLLLRGVKRLRRRTTRLRYWLILALRVLALALLVVAVARPLASGRLGSTLGGAPDTTIVLLDRSASMEERDARTGTSKREAGLRRIAEFVALTGERTRLVLIDSGENEAVSIASAELLSELPQTRPTDASADLAAMLQTAWDHIVANRSGVTDIWICSDMRAADWRADDGRWAVLRERFRELDRVRFLLLADDEVAPENVSVRATAACRRVAGQTTELVLDVRLRRSAFATGAPNVPVAFVMNGARSVEVVSMTGSEAVLQGHVVPLDAQVRGGWGYVELPPDANPRDNRYYFAFGGPDERHTAIVSDDPAEAEALRIAALSSPDPSLTCSARVVTRRQLSDLSWDTASLLLWLAPLPEGAAAQQVASLLGSGRPVIFFAPPNPDGSEFAGVTWKGWRQAEDGASASVLEWDADADLLKNADSGEPLPVDQLTCPQHCTLDGTFRTMARLRGGWPLLVRVEQAAGPAYFCATRPHPACSNLADEGVVLYVMVHRALALGAEARGAARQLDAGTPEARDAAAWPAISEPLPGNPADTSWLQAAVRRDSDMIVAVNRPAAEDDVGTIGGEDLQRLFHGLAFQQVRTQNDSGGSLARELWRGFVIAVAMALLVEAWLCLPETSGQVRFRDGSTPATSGAGGTARFGGGEPE